MVPPHFFSQGVLLALVWLFVIVCLTWPQPSVTAPATPEPFPPQRTRSHEPTPFYLS